MTIYPIKCKEEIIFLKML